MYKPSLISGALFAMLSVILGAFGAHYLKTVFSPELLLSFETGVRYQFYHSIALCIAGLLPLNSRSHHNSIFLCFLGGILLFSGSIYALCILKSQMQIGLQGLGILTPIGGLFFIAGWLLLIVHIVRMRSAELR